MPTALLQLNLRSYASSLGLALGPWGAAQGGARKMFCRWREPPVDAVPSIRPEADTRLGSHVITDLA
jgi:hypothetical protein